MADELGITAEDANALRAAAEEFGQSVAYFDAQAAGIKDKHIPNLTEDDARQLTTLQKRKEALITSTVAALPAKLGRQLADRLSSFIAGHVKPRVRSFQPPSPAEHLHGLLRQRNGGSPRFVNASYAPAQTYNNFGMGAYGHLYVDGWQDTAAHSVYGRGLVTEDYNSYGHTWSISTRVYNPDGTRSTSQLAEWYRATTSSTTSLPVLDDFGDFFIQIEVKEKCPYIYGLIALGVFLLDPPDTVMPSTPLHFDKALLQDSYPPRRPESAAFASAIFNADAVNFNIRTTVGPDACGGEGFIIQATFRPPPDSAFCCTLTSIAPLPGQSIRKGTPPDQRFYAGHLP